jgi:hypothetical protein
MSAADSNLWHPPTWTAPHPGDQPLTIADLPALAAELRDRLAAKDPDKYPIVQIGVQATTAAVVFRVLLYGRKSVFFEGDTLDNAVAQAWAWLDFDEKGECNRAVGLAADGSFLEVAE